MNSFSVVFRLFRFYVFGKSFMFPISPTERIGDYLLLFELWLIVDRKRSKQGGEEERPRRGFEEDDRMDL
uniref:Putative secreted protein n=1 Tax=Anopheles darlingi TaxID=43151 RepID=A0A2M4D6F3_ANODA